MKEFLETIAMTGNMRTTSTTSGKVIFPPENETEWGGGYVDEVCEWFREAAINVIWDTEILCCCNTQNEYSKKYTGTTDVS